MRFPKYAKRFFCSRDFECAGNTRKEDRRFSSEAQIAAALDFEGDAILFKDAAARVRVCDGDRGKSMTSEAFFTARSEDDGGSAGVLFCHRLVLPDCRIR